MTFDARTLEHPPGPAADPPPTRSEDDLRRLLDQIAEMWLDGMSQAQVAEALQLSRGIVSGLISRARVRGDDVRFLSRPRPPRQPRARRLEADREHYRRQHPSAARRVAEIEALVVKELPLRPAPAPSGPVSFAELQAGQCKFVVNDAERSSGFLFCAQPVEKFGANWCPEHAAKVRGGAGTGGKFILRSVTNKLG